MTAVTVTTEADQLDAANIFPQFLHIFFTFWQ